MTKQNKEIENQCDIHGVISRLNDLEKVLYENANKNPNNLKDQLSAGKQHAYSHIYFEVKNILKEQAKKDVGYINWKIMNLILGFAIGGLFVLYALNGL